MPKRLERTPDELAAENEKLRRRADKLKYERDLERKATAGLIQALRNTLSGKYLGKIEEERRRLIYDKDEAPYRQPVTETWDDLVRWFTFAYESLANRKLVPVEFREIVLPPRQGRTLREDAVDWWPLDQLASRTSEVRGEIWISRYESRKGIELTAEMLWEHRTEPEAVVAIWLSAFLHEQTEARREAIDYDLVRSLQELVPAEKMFGWHHAMRNVAPWELMTRISSLLNVRELHEIVDLLAATAALAMSTYTLVHFVETPRIIAAE